MKIFFDGNKNQTGFSLLEVLLYIGLASIILMVMGSSIHGILKIQVKSQTVSEVEQQGAAVIQKISQKIRNADSIVNIVSTSTVQNIKIQRGVADIGNIGGTKTAPTDFAAFASTSSAFVLNNSNRYTNDGRTTTGSINMEVDDMSGAIALTNASTISFYRDSASDNNNHRFHWEAWEYIGDVGGVNEFIVRGRYQINITAGNRTGTDTVSSCVDRDKCIPFITGILNSAPSNDADNATALAWMSADNTITVERGGNTDTTIIYGVVVEFTGSNWSVGHGRTGDVSGDTGTINLIQESIATTGTTYNVSSWNNAIIFHQFKADDASSNQAITDTSAIYYPGTGSSAVDWSFQSDHDATNNQHMVHILENVDMTVTRYSGTGNLAGDNNINISSAGLTDLSNAAVVGSSNSSGGGTAYARGWKGIYLTSKSNVSAWAHRSGNTIATRIQVIEMPMTEVQVIGSVTTTTQDIVIQRGLANVGVAGSGHVAPTNFTEFSSMGSAFVLNNSNRYTNSGQPGYNSTLYVDDLSGAIALTATGTINFYRQAGSKASDMRFNWESWEYVGASGGPNEFVVRGRYQVTINAGDRTSLDTVDYCATRSKCIPFITGILSSNTTNDSNDLTAISWMSGDNEVSVERGGVTGDTVVYGVVVEFTGSNWSVGHGKTSNVTADTGTIDLYQKSAGISGGDSYSVSDWSDAIIFHQFKGDDTTVNEAIADTSATYFPGGNNSEVSWYFNGNHDATDNQHMVHVLNNIDMNVVRYTNTGSLQNDNNVAISSVDTSNTAIMSSANSSGTGTAFGRGWKGVYLTSANNVNAWAHRSGNTLQTRIQVIEMPGSEWTFKLQLVELDTSITGFGLSNGRIFISEAGKYYFLTSDRVLATGLYFDDYSRSGTTGLISFGFDLDYNSDSIRYELNYDKFFQSSASILNK